MGAFTGSLSFTTFHVQGEVEPDFRESFLQGIKREAFRPLTVEEEADESIGWCAIDHPFDIDLDYEKVFLNSYLNLGLRIDKWRIPTALFKAFFTDAERQHLAATDKEKLTRSEKEDLKAVVTATLKRQLIPTMKVIDFSWNLDTGIVRFWNGSTRMQEIIEDIFETTFGLRLVRDNPYMVATYLELHPEQLKALETVEPTPFHAKGNFIQGISQTKPEEIIEGA